MNFTHKRNVLPVVNLLHAFVFLCHLWLYLVYISCVCVCMCVCQVIVHEVPGQELEVEVFDKDPDQDDFLGR